MSKIIFTLTADWEGEHFKDLNDFKGIRKFIGTDIPVTHFISPSYFTEKLSRPENRILSAIEEGDEIALHIHCLRSLVRKAGVDFLDSPDFFEPFTPEIRKLINFLPKGLRPKVSGRGVPLSAYAENDIDLLLEISRQLLSALVSQNELVSFRAGGWMASDTVLRSLMKYNFKYDSSAAPPSILSQGYSENTPGNFNDDYGGNNGKFTEYILKLWGKDIQNEHFVSNKLNLKFCPDAYVKKTTQPYRIGSLIEMPNNAGVSDYASVEKTLMYIVKWAITEIQNGREKPVFINTGFHQEGDIAYKMPIVNFFKALSSQDRTYIEFHNLKDAGKIAQKFLLQE
jgi:hypothetical protein